MPRHRRLSRVAGSVRAQVTAAAYILGWRLVRLLPERVARALFDRIADQVHRRDGRGVRQLRRNLARVVSTSPSTGAGSATAADVDLDQLTRAALRSYLRYWCESFRLPSWPVADLVRRTRTVDEHIIRDALARGRGVVVALPHMGNWDWAGAWSCAELAPLMTVAERLEPARLYDEFVAYREGLGMRILPMTPTPPASAGPALPQSGSTGAQSFGRLVEWVERGGLVCLLADRELSRSGVAVTLCGEEARMPRGPAVLARRTSAALIPVTLHYEGDAMVATFHEEVPHADGEAGAAEMMQGVADAFTPALRAHPQDWHMMQKVFTGDLHPARR